MIENDTFNLQRFIQAQDAYGTYDQAISELKNGRKMSHWIWFVFPQMKGLGMSYNSNFYGIIGVEEAKAYLSHPVLNQRLREACNCILNQSKHGNSMRQVLGGIDALKTFSSLTLFDSVSPNDVFAECLKFCYGDKRDHRTLELLRK